MKEDVSAEKYGKPEERMDSFVRLEDVTKIYRMGEVKIAAAAGINFEIKKGCGSQRSGKDDSLKHSWRDGYGDGRNRRGGWRGHFPLFSEAAHRIPEG